MTVDVVEAAKTWNRVSPTATPVVHRPGPSPRFLARLGLGVPPLLPTEVGILLPVAWPRWEAQIGEAEPLLADPAGGRATIRAPPGPTCRPPNSDG